MLLERFVRRGLDRLAEGELGALERLLEQPDQDILEWLTSTTGASHRSICGQSPLSFARTPLDNPDSADSLPAELVGPT